MFRIENRTDKPLPAPCGTLIPARGSIEVQALGEPGAIWRAWQRAGLVVVNEVVPVKRERARKAQAIREPLPEEPAQLDPWPVSRDEE